MENWGAAAFGVAVTALGGLIALYQRLTRLEVKTDTLWDLLMRRGWAEARMNDILTRNSPLQVGAGYTDTAERLRQLYGPELIAYYNSGDCKRSEREQFMDIEKRFGRRLVDDVCIPYKVSQGACIWLAMFVGRELAAKQRHLDSAA